MKKSNDTSTTTCHHCIQTSQIHKSHRQKRAFPHVPPATRMNTWSAVSLLLILALWSFPQAQASGGWGVTTAPTRADSRVTALCSDYNNAHDDLEGDDTRVEPAFWTTRNGPTTLRQVQYSFTKSAVVSSGSSDCEWQHLESLTLPCGHFPRARQPLPQPTTTAFAGIET